MTAPATNAAAALGELFAPWREALLTAHLRPLSDVASTRDDPSVWIEADFPHDDPARRSRVIEAMELFILLERADRAAWLDESRRFATHWRESPWAKYVFETRPSPRLCGWKMVIDDLEDFIHLCTYLGQEARGDDAVSAAYLQLRRELENTTERRDSHAISLFLDVSLPMGEWRRVWEVLPPLLSLAGLQASATSNARIDALRSRLEVVNLPPTILAPVENSVLDQLAQLSHFGVIIDRFPDPKITVTRENAVAFLTLIKTLVGSQSSSVLGRTRRVAVLSREYPQGSIELATTDSTTVCQVYASCPGDVEGGADGQKNQSYWMTYALFSRDAGVRNVRVDCRELTLANVTAMEELLRADEPLALLFEDLSKSISDHKLTRLTTSRFLLFDPTIEASDENPVLEGTRYQNLRVLGSMEKWYIVLLPGWGKAWVHKQDAQLTRTETAIDGVKLVELLELVSPRDPAATAALVRLVGTKVINLHMTGFGDVPEDWWNDIFNSCRKAQEVCIDGIMWSHLSAIVESLTTSRARKLERLFLRIQYITRENVAEVREILAALTDQGHPFSKQLREFGFSAGAIVFGDVIVDPDIFSQALQMLEASKTLQFFRFDLPRSVRTTAQSTALKSAFDRFQDRGGKSTWCARKGCVPLSLAG